MNVSLGHSKELSNLLRKAFLHRSPVSAPRATFQHHPSCAVQSERKNCCVCDKVSGAFLPLCLVASPIIHALRLSGPTNHEEERAFVLAEVSGCN